MEQQQYTSAKLELEKSMSVCLTFPENWQIGYSIVASCHIIMPDRCGINFRK